MTRGCIEHNALKSYLSFPSVTETYDSHFQSSLQTTATFERVLTPRKLTEVDMNAEGLFIIL